MKEESLYYRNHIVVSFSIEGFHNWSDASIFSSQVDFLQHRHRHMFTVKAEKPVFHDNRSIEIILFQRELKKYLIDRFMDPIRQTVEFGEMSCEMIARELSKAFGLTSCEVLEDGENGARIVCEPFSMPSVLFVTGMTASGKNTFIQKHLVENNENVEVISISSIVRSTLRELDRAASTTQDLCDSKDIDEKIADNVIAAVRHQLAINPRKKIVIDGPRQIAIMSKVVHVINGYGLSWRLVWLEVDAEERERRFLQRKRSEDKGLSLKELDLIHTNLGIFDFKEYAQSKINGIILKN